MTFTLDTNILVGLNRLYPRDIFPGLWDSVEASVAAGQSCICEAVLKEVYRGGDELHAWAKNLPDFVCTTTQSEFATVKQIADDHPGWVQDQKNEADPFVVAHAKNEPSTIVSEEGRKGPGTLDKNQKIPNIADEHGVGVVTFFEYVRLNSWTF